MIARFGEVRPFSRVIEAERRHQQFLLELFDRYGLTPPEWKPHDDISVPATLREACEKAVQAEIENAALYDRLLAEVSRPDITATFRHLRDASRDRHLPAFERCRRAGRGPR